MKVLHIVGDSKWGGGGTIILGLIEMARGLGWQAEVLATDPVCRAAFDRHRVPVIPLDVIWRSVRPVRDLRGLYQLYNFLRTHPYDLVHTHTSKAGFVGRIAARMAGVPAVIHTAHSFSFHEESRLRESLSYRALETFAGLFCDRIVTVSNYHRDWGRKLRIASASKLVAIPNGIEEPSRSGCSIDFVRSQLGLQPREMFVFTPGRLCAGKGLEYLIDAIPMLSGSVPFRLAFAGDGPLRAALAKQASDRGVSDRLLFLGFRNDIGDLLNASDLVVLPSLHEGMSIALLEAMAAKKAIIATNIGANCEATERGDGALLVPVKSARSLACALDELLNDPSRRDSLGSRARRLFEAHHTASNMLNGYRRLYLELIDSAQTASGRSIGSSLWHQKE